jgi:PAS domain S-box-containing protein
MSPILRPEHLLAAVLSSTEDGLLTFALDGAIHTWSRGAEHLYGYSEAEIAGQPLARLLPVSEAPTYEGLLRAAIKENSRTVRTPNACVKTDGSFEWP